MGYGCFHVKAERQVNTMAADGRIEIDTRIERNHVEQELRELQKQFNQMHREMMRGQRKALIPYQKQILEVEKKFFELGQGLNTFEGTNQELMARIRQLGAEHKKATDNMIKNNHFLTQSYIRQAATFMNASTHAEKLHDIYKQTNPLLAKYTAHTLKATAAMQRFYNSGSAAQIALEALGKSADPKKLRDFTRNLNQSLAQVPILALGAVAAFGLLTYAIAKAAKGPNVSEIREKINQALTEYRDTLHQRTQEIYDTWKLFEKAQINAVNPKTLLENLQGQVAIIRDWLKNLAELAKRGVDEGLIQELREMGPAAAGEIHALTQMSDSELNKYVQLWKEKHRLAKTAALTELEQLKQKTEEKVKKLKDSITPLGAAAERFKATWAQALEPFVKTWGVIFAKIVDAATAIGELINKMNSVSPIISTVIFSILYLTTILTLLAIPLALVGKWMLGLRAIAFMFLRPMGALASLMSTSISIAFAWAAALVGVGVALYLLWTRSETFRNAVITGWQAIQQAASTTWDFILNNVLLPVWNAIVSLGGKLFAQLKEFWDTNGKQIMKIAQVVWDFISTYVTSKTNGMVKFMETAFTILKSIVQSVWGSIQGIIQGAVGVILNIIGIFANLLTGNWEGVWENVKDLVQNAWKLIGNVVSLGIDAVLGLIRGLGKSVGGEFEKIAERFYKAGKGFMEMLKKGIEDMVGKVLGAIEKVAGKMRDFLPFSPAKVGPLSDLDKLDFAGPIRDSIMKGLPIVQASLNHMLQMPTKPTIQVAGSAPNTTLQSTAMAASNQPTYLVMDRRIVAELLADDIQEIIHRNTIPLQRFEG
jgi:phage-related protein